jgi:hypothetical protein
MAVFEKILVKAITNRTFPTSLAQAREWFREEAQKLRMTPNKFFKDKELRKVKQPQIGSMYAFRYDPLGKKELPYYDTFPMIFMIERYTDGFLGINLHYLPYPYRSKLMDALYTITNNTKYDQTTKLKISYEVLKGATKFKLFKPCIKRYLINHVKSPFIEIDANKWDIALFLPLHRFKKATAADVWKDSTGR